MTTATTRCVMCSETVTHESRLGNPVCDRCDPPPRPAHDSGFDDVEWWDMTDLEASVQASMEPRT